MVTTIAADVCYAIEKSHVEVKFTFRDEKGSEVLAKSIQYSLTDNQGNVVDNLDGIALTPALNNSLTLKGSNLSTLPGENGAEFVWRHLTIEGIVDTSLGTNLPINGILIFPLYNAVHIK